MGFSILVLTFNFNIIYLLINFTPPRSPPILVPVLVLIELVSNLARPVSLSVRIIANISCRHLLLFLCRSLFLILNIFKSFFYLFLDYIFNLLISFVNLFVILIFFILETIVAFIQAYIFITLLIIYYTDIRY